MILSKSAQQALTRALAAANDNRQTVEDLEALAQIDPRLADRVADLRRRIDYLTMVSQTALELDRSSR